MEAYDEAISRGIISSNPTQQEIIDHADEIIKLVDAIREARKSEDKDIDCKLDIAKRSVKRIAEIAGEWFILKTKNPYQ